MIEPGRGETRGPVPCPETWDHGLISDTPEPIPTRPRCIVVGVSGSIAAYRAPLVIRALREAGHEVKTAPTEVVLRFIGASALTTVSEAPVSSSVFDNPAAVEHVAVGEWAELVVITPTSADLLVRVAVGRADDLFTTTIPTTTTPVMLAPAMHAQMWLDPATQENVATLRRRGLTALVPDSGHLTGKDSGVGRLPKPDRVVTEALALLESSDIEGRSNGLEGRCVVVLAGGTHRPINPVRLLGDRSSGRQGYAIARAVAVRGAYVILTTARVSASALTRLPASIRVIPVNTALEFNGVVRHLCIDADAVVMAAAVADYRPATVSAAKVEKHGLEDDETGSVPPPVITLAENPDILAKLVSDPPRGEDGRTLVAGFAAGTGDEDSDVLSRGIVKAWRRGANLLAINAVGPALGFGDVSNAVVVLGAQGREVARASDSKDDAARALMDLVAERLESN